MAEGEVLQLYYNGNPLITESEYLRIVENKTAGLIAAACKIGAIIGNASDDQQDALFRFGQRIGIAFQVADDTLDYAANGERLGKSLGQDLRQGKTTLPLLHLLQHCPDQDKQMIKDRMETRTLSDGDLRRIISLDAGLRVDCVCPRSRQQFVMAATLDLASFEESSPTASPVDCG